MEKLEFKVRARLKDIICGGTDRIDLVAWQIQGNDVFAAQRLEFKETEPLTYAEPFLSLDKQSAQQLMDDLWQCGLRPSEGSGSAGSLKATQNHLGDMRKIVFKQLKIGD